MTRRHPGALRTSRGSSQGQVVPIFALIAVVLFAATGLAVDAGLSYLTYNGSERAAASAALAGVPYMPNGLPGGTYTSTTCAGTAGAAACAATARDGLANGSTVNGHPVTVTVARYPAGCGVAPACADNKLTVQVTAWVQPTFLHVLGFGDHQVTATDTAFFLPPISLGQPGAQLGSTEAQLGTGGSNYYFLRSEGYGTNRGEGDAYDPFTTNANISCNSGVTENPAPQGTSTDVHTLNASAGTDVSDATLSGTPPGFNLLPERGGYNFSIAVPTTVPAAHAMVYNPAFAPDGGFNPAGGSYNLHEQDGSFSGNAFTDQYSAMEYTLFKVNDQFDHSSDTPLSQVVVDPLNVTITGGAVTSFVDVANGQTLTPGSPNPQIAAAFNYILANVYHSWVDVGSPPSASTAWTSGGTNYNIFHVVKTTGALTPGATTSGAYRLRADMLDYKGLRPGDDGAASLCSRAHKGYAVQLATAGGAECVDPGCQVSALDELAVYTPFIASAMTPYSIPLFQLPADYAGQTINFYIYDVGDVSGINQISIINPDTQSCAPSSAPCLFTSPTGVPVFDLGGSRNTAPTTGAGGNEENSVDSCASPQIQPNGNQALINSAQITGCAGRTAGDFFDARWLLFQLHIPSTYAGAGGAYWQMSYSLASGTASDTFTLAVNYANSPVHLL